MITPLVSSNLHNRIVSAGITSNDKTVTLDFNYKQSISTSSLRSNHLSLCFLSLILSILMSYKEECILQAYVTSHKAKIQTDSSLHIHSKLKLILKHVFFHLIFWQYLHNFTVRFLNVSFAVSCADKTSIVDVLQTNYAWLLAIINFCEKKSFFVFKSRDSFHP